MIDEIDYFPRRDKYKKKKGGDSGEEWNALKKIKTSQDEKSKPKGEKIKESQKAKNKRPDK